MSRWTRWQRVLAVSCAVALLCGAMAMTAAKNAVAALTGATPPNLLNPESKAKA